MALVALAVLAGAAVQSATGLGFALVCGPVLFAVLGPEAAVVTVTALGLVLSGLVLAGERRRPRVAWREVAPLLAAAAPGAACGVVLLRALPESVLQVAVGVAVLGAVALRAAAPRRPPSPGDARARAALGFATGTLSTSTGMTGPPLALWLARRGLGPAELRDSLGALFVGLGAVAAVALAPVVADADLDAGVLAAALASVAAGHALGRRVFTRLRGRRYEPVLLGVIALTGIASVVAGLNGAT